MSSIQRFTYFYAVVASITILNVLFFRLGGYEWSSARKNGQRFSLRGADPLPRSYMLALRIPEQLTMSTIHFHQFLNLVNDWNFTGVEPVAYESTMYGLRSLHASNPRGSLPFNKLYNVTMHNSYISECMKREQTPHTPFLFEPQTEFLRRSYRKLVLVHFAGRGDIQSALTKDIYEKMENEIQKEANVFSDCSSAAKTTGMFKRIEQHLSKEIQLERSYPTSRQSLELHSNLKEFEVVQAFCIKRNIKISLRDLRNFIFERIIKQNVEAQNQFDHGVSIVFLSWQGRFTHPLVDSDVKNYINNCRLPFSRPFHSDYVKTLAKRYLESQLSKPDQPYLSVHVRFEKLFYYPMRHTVERNEYLDCCMNRLNTLISLVAKKFSIDKGNILINWDYSPYGSMVCPIPNCKHLANEYVKKLNVKPSYFDPKGFDVPPHHALISLVEMHALNGGSALVTVGEGSYQFTIIESFIEHHRYQDSDAAEKLHYGHLCLPPEELHELAADLGGGKCYL